MVGDAALLGELGAVFAGLVGHVGLGESAAERDFDGSTERVWGSGSSRSCAGFSGRCLLTDGGQQLADVPANQGTRAG